MQPFRACQARKTLHSKGRVCHRYKNIILFSLITLPYKISNKIKALWHINQREKKNMYPRTNIHIRQLCKYKTLEFFSHSCRSLSSRQQKIWLKSFYRSYVMNQKFRTSTRLQTHKTFPREGSFFFLILGYNSALFCGITFNYFLQKATYTAEIKARCTFWLRLFLSIVSARFIKNVLFRINNWNMKTIVKDKLK